MRFRHTILCLAVILSCLTHGSDMAHGQSPALLEAQNRYTTLYQQGRYSEAISYAAKALRLGEEELGPDHPTTALLLSYLALSFQGQGNYAEAELLFHQSLAISEKGFGPEHPTVAASLNNLAELHRIQGNYAEAEPLYRRSLAIREKAFGPEHPDVATSVNNLAIL